MLLVVMAGQLAQVMVVSTVLQGLQPGMWERKAERETKFALLSAAIFGL